MAVLFGVLAVGLGAIAVAAARAGAWVPALAAGAIAVWMAGLAAGVVRRHRRGG